MDNITDFRFEGSWRPLALWFRDSVLPALPALQVAIVCYDRSTQQATHWEPVAINDELLLPGNSVREAVVEYAKSRPETAFSLLLHLSPEELGDLPVMPNSTGTMTAAIFGELVPHDKYFVGSVLVTDEDYRYALPKIGRVTPSGVEIPVQGNRVRFDDPEDKGEGMSAGDNPDAHAELHRMRDKAEATGHHDMALAMDAVLDAQHNDDEDAERIALANLMEMTIAEMKRRGMTGSTPVTELFSTPTAAEPFEDRPRRSIFELPAIDKDEPHGRIN